MLQQNAHMHTERKCVYSRRFIFYLKTQKSASEERNLPLIYDYCFVFEASCTHTCMYTHICKIYLLCEYLHFCAVVNSNRSCVHFFAANAYRIYVLRTLFVHILNICVKEQICNYFSGNFSLNVAALSLTLFRSFFVSSFPLQFHFQARNKLL